MLIRKIRPDTLIKNRKRIIGLALIIYTGTVFSAGVLFYRSGEFRRYQSLLLPFSKSFRERPIQRIINQFTSETPLVFDINHLNTLKISNKQKEASKNNELFADEDDWVNAQISYGKNKLKAKIRLKGQFRDHWREDGLWSYKVKISSDKTLFGMDRFAVQHPRTRSFINEWIYHRILSENSIVSLRYNFIPLIINGKKLPAFAIEENFGTRMLENNKRREGPIFRLQIRVSPEERFINTISFYQFNKFNSTIRGRDLMRRAERLISGFMNGDLIASEVFDIKLMAKAYAISDLFGDDHSLLAYNMRYYLNPISGLIEPVPYDQQNIRNVSEKGIVGERYQHYSPNKIITNNLISMMFNDKDFSFEYAKALNKISKKAYLNRFFTSIEEDLSKQLAILQKSYTRYDFKEKAILYNNQEYISSLLRPRKPLSAYIVGSNPSTNQLNIKLTNMHTLPIEINSISTPDQKNIGLNSEANMITNRYKICEGKLCKKMIAPINKYQNISLYLQDSVSSPDLPQFTIKANVVGSDFLFDVPLYSPNEYFNGTPSNSDISNLDYISVDPLTKNISFNKPYVLIDRNLIIPKGFSLRVKEGTYIDLIDDSFILSYSPIILSGTKDKPIILTSSDKTGQGLLVVNADSPSTLSNVSFDNLRLINKLGLNITGSITFFNSDINIDNCNFKLLKAEDGLNIVNSNFTITNSSFSDIYSDALDVDFSTGSLTNLDFNLIGNDAIDLSGSVVNVNNIDINTVGDKGISIGEESKVSIQQANIMNSIIGIAIKDQSNLNGEYIFVSNSSVGIAGYNKKNWFSGSTTKLTNTKLYKNSEDYLNEIGSIMNINNSPIQANIRNLYKNYYAIP